MPIRSIKKGTRSLTGKYPSKKTGRMVAFESSLERDFIYLLEFDIYVRCYEEQPVKIQYGEKRCYTPDILACYWKARPILFEVKYSSELQEKKEELAPKFEAARQYSQELDYQFKVITEQDIRGIHLDNVKFLLGYRHVDVNEHHVTILMRMMKELNTATPRSLLLAASQDEWKRAELLYVLWYLLANYAIAFDNRSLLDMQTPIWYIGPYNIQKR